jgi:hypothetical protein
MYFTERLSGVPMSLGGFFSNYSSLLYSLLSRCLVFFVRVDTGCGFDCTFKREKTYIVNILAEFNRSSLLFDRLMCMNVKIEGSMHNWFAHGFGTHL